MSLSKSSKRVVRNPYANICSKRLRKEEHKEPLNADGTRNQTQTVNKMLYDAAEKSSTSSCVQDRKGQGGGFEKDTLAGADCHQKERRKDLPHHPQLQPLHIPVKRDSAELKGSPRELDTSIDWEAAIVQLDQACAERENRTATEPEKSHDSQPSRFQGVVSGSYEAKGLHASETNRPASVYRTQHPDQRLNQPNLGTNLSDNGSSLQRPSASLSRSPLGKQSLGQRHVDLTTASGGSTTNHHPVAALGYAIRPSSWVKQESESRATISSTSSNFHSATTRATAHQLTDALLPATLQYSQDRVRPVDDEFRQTLVKNANVSSPLLNGWTLYSHQKRAILKGLLMRRSVLALDMGLGKTLIGCVWARSFYKTFSPLKIYIICPVSLKKEWKRTAEEATGLEVSSDNPKKPFEAAVNICSWAKIPQFDATGDNKYVVVCDEAHSMQSMKAARTQNVLKLAKHSRCLGVLLLTGTPMKNGKPANLFPLLKAVRHPFGDNQREYEKHFCDGHDKSFGSGRPVWDANGSSNLPQLRAHIASHLLYLSKDQCLKDLPPRTRISQKVPVSSRSLLRHNNALNDLAQLYENVHRMENGNDAILGAVQRVRQVGSFAKIDATVSLAKLVLEKEPAVVIFTSFVKVAEQVHSKLAESGWKGELLTGETAQQKRQPMVDNFQAGLSPVFICTFGAGGVGLTLTAAQTIILLDRPWTPGDAHQAEDRVRRIGQTKPVRSFWMVAFDLDEQIDAVLEKKSQNSNAVLDREARNDNNMSLSAPKISIFKLLTSVLPKCKHNVQTQHECGAGANMRETL